MLSGIEKFLDQHNKGEGSKGGIPLTISWEMSLVCMECYSGKGFFKCGRMFLRNPNCEWLHCYVMEFPESNGLKVC